MITTGGMLKKVREMKPLVCQITNNVTINDCANVTLCTGGSPVMSDSMADAIEMVGMYKRFYWQSPVNYVWDGLLVHMLANQNPVFIPLTAFFIAYLRIGAEIMSRATDLDPEVVTFLQGIIILLVASERFLYKFKQKHEQKLALEQAELASAQEGGNA